MKISYLFFLIVLLSSCDNENPYKEEEQVEYSSSEIRTYRFRYPNELIIGYDVIGVKLISSTKKNEVLSVFYDLKYSTKICSKENGVFSLDSGCIFVRGYFNDGKSEFFKGLPKLDDMAGGFEAREFLLKGWGIQAPYFSYPQNEDDGSIGLEPVYRTEVSDIDFNNVSSLDRMMVNSTSDLFWWGQMPNISEVSEN